MIILVTVIDAMCGAGKSEYAIGMLRDNPYKKFVYITPYRDEIERVLSSVEKSSVSEFTFTPKLCGHEYGNKLDNFKKLLTRGNNIVATHALFYLMDEEVLELLLSQNYTLILDEVMNVVEPINLTVSDTKNVLNTYVTVDDKEKVTWLDDEYTGKFEQLMYIAKRGQLYYCDGQFFMWIFPVEIFTAFENIFICTYMFDDQIQRYYYMVNKVEYKKVSIKDGKLIPYEMQTSNIDKIHILDHKINLVGEGRFALSKAWFEKKKNTTVKVLKKNMLNYKKHIAKFNSDDIIWTTFKDFEKDLRGDGYAKGFLSSNARAINKFSDRHFIMYCVNKFLNPYTKKYFSNRECPVNEENYAVSEMLQFIYRSAVRNGEDVYCYIPSKRMRELLIKFIDDRTQNKD